MSDAPEPLSNRLTRQAHNTFVGRQDELSVLHELLCETGPLVVSLYGIAGVCKSTLLSMFAEQARRGGATATRDQILDNVWGNLETSCSSNVVDAVVKPVRRKLSEDSDRLETVRGFGYRWRCE
ncbi:MAG: AAA family ATPase [bacterium]|nr:AAA family ATPase [bacterium]